VLKKDLFTLTANETAELDYIRTVLGKDIDKRENEIAGVALHALPSEDIARFVRILTQSRRPVSKEIICKALWNLQYDPSIHDGRLYKLVHHTRRAFPKNDVVLNEYGSYRINPIYQTQGA
jgi:DNA-binding SARP family transcriptional activator